MIKKKRRQVRRTPKYPPAPTTGVVDDYFGTKVADPFRPLEHAHHPATVAWVEAQNELTRSMLDRPEREQIKRQLTELFDYPRISPPLRKKNRLFFSRNEGLQNQPVYYLQEGLAGAPEVLIDPNELSPEGTAAVTHLSVSDNAKLIGYAISESGSDQQKIYVRDVDSRKDLPDKIEWVKFTGIDWTPDNLGFYYTRLPVPGTVPPGDEHYFPKLYYHRVGTSQSVDVLIYERPGEREVAFGSRVSHDGRYLTITAVRGTADESEIFLADLSRPGHHFVPVFTGFRHKYAADEILDGQMYILTNHNAPNGRVIAVDIRDLTAGAEGVSGSRIREVIPESRDHLEWITMVNRKIIAHYLHNASSVLKIFEVDGREVKTVDLPALGSIAGLTGQVNDTEMFFAFQSFTRPPANYRYDFPSGELPEFGKPEARFDPDRYETVQIWYPSRDGTPVSMFLSSKKGLRKDRDTPVFLYGYGGFNIPMVPYFNPAHFYFLERGGIFAVANLRGGSEYGEPWHRAGMLANRQNVFDDFAAAAEWLIANGFTRPERLAVSGRSNGGLLAAVSLVQRPELFRAVVVQVPLTDMLRYHLFTLARFWIPEYGCSENREQFEFLHRYSPLHNVRDGIAYPAILITTADTDDRTDPGHAKKFAARLQQAQGGDEPILLRVETKAGHSSGNLGTGGKPVSKLIDEWADLWTFVFMHLSS